MNSVLLACAVQMALNSIYFGTLTGFDTVIAIATAGFCKLSHIRFPPSFLLTSPRPLTESSSAIDLSYAMPLLARILSRFTGHAKVLPGPYTLGRYGIYLNAIGVLFLVFISIAFNLPTLRPVTQENMNYTSAATGVIGLISLVTWIFDGRKNFTGPEEGGVGNAVEGEIVGEERSSDGLGEKEEVKE